MRCSGNIEICIDDTCIRYQQHNTCENHPFHYGDRVRNISKNKYGYIYDSNPLKSKRSITIKYDDNRLEKIFGHKVCTNIELQNEPRNLAKINPRYI